MPHRRPPFATSLWPLWLLLCTGTAHAASGLPGDPIPVPPEVPSGMGNVNASFWETTSHGVVRVRHLCYSPKAGQFLVFGRNASVKQEAVSVRLEYKKVQTRVGLHHTQVSVVTDAVWVPRPAVIVPFSGKHANLWHLFQIYLRYLNLLRVEAVSEPADALLLGESEDRPLHAPLFGPQRIVLSLTRSGPPRCYSQAFIGLTAGFDAEDVQNFVQRVHAHFNVVPAAAPRCPPLLLMAERTTTRTLFNWPAVVASVQALLPGFEVRSVRWHTLSLEAQVRLSSAGVAALVGVHGQNLLWTAFMGPPAVLVQLCPPRCAVCQPSTPLEPCYEPLARARNVTAVRVHVRFSAKHLNHSRLAPCDRSMQLPPRETLQIAEACNATLRSLAEQCHRPGIASAAPP